MSLEGVFKKLDWDGKGLKIDGLYLSHLRFADDIVLISTDIQELKSMLQDLSEKSKKIGLKMNLDKTKIISNRQEDITIENTIMKKVEKYIHLGHIIKNEKEN